MGTIEWHERHLPLGNDGLNAHGLCVRVAERMGGVVLPPLYWGVDRWLEKDGNMLRGKDWNVGYALPGSMYQLEEPLFEQLLRQALKEIFAQRIEVVVLVAGHNARQVELLVERMEAKVSELLATAGRKGEKSGPCGDEGPACA